MSITTRTPDAPTGAPTKHTWTVGKAGQSEIHKAVALVVALTGGLSLILALFVSVAVNSGPNGIRIAVAGPPPAVAQIQDGFGQLAGADAFEVSVVSDEAAARSALAERSADGAIVVGPNGPVVYTASAGAPVIAQALSTAAAHLANPAATGPAVVDVVALPSGDSRGTGLPAGSFPMIIAGLALGAACAFALRNRWTVVTTIVGGSAVIGLSFAGILAWLGVSGGHYFAESSAIALTIASGALLVAGLVRLIGTAGAAIAAFVLLLVGNPLSGIATSPRFLPGPWGDLGQWLPTGAGGTLLRTVSYFPAAPIGWPLAVLLAWAGLGLIGVIYGRAKLGHGAGAAVVQPEPAVPQPL